MGPVTYRPWIAPQRFTFCALSLAIFATILRASSLLSDLAADRRRAWPGSRLSPRSPVHSLGLGRYRLLRDRGGEKTMANWKRLTSPSGDNVYLNLDVMIGMQRNPDINITFLQSVSDPRVNIEVRETPDEILSASST